MIYRPQHFVGHEVPYGIARMMLDGSPVCAPIGRTSEVVAVAKKVLKAGTILDGEGGYTVYGLIERASIATAQKLLPIGLTQQAEIVREVPEDGVLTYDDVKLPESFALHVRRLQDAQCEVDSAYSRPM